MPDDKLWMLIGRALGYVEFGAQEIVSTFLASDMGKALETARELIEEDEADAFQLIRIGTGRPDDFHVMWSWWTDRDGAHDERGDHWKQRSDPA